ncbi:MAG: BspA family leucine-rich repeat surface protein [Proteobacteria bacterium]|nr:BspA family leucine-rich repeat surface protein [Pseudomonadota bacterium]
MKRLLIVCIGLMILAEGCTLEVYGDKCSDWVAIYEDGERNEGDSIPGYAREARGAGYCPDNYVCSSDSNKKKICRMKCNEGTFLCNEQCLNREKYRFSLEDVEGVNYCIATLICSDNCINGCKEDGSCKCPEKCVNGCNDDGSCKPLEGCQNGVNDDGTCRCPDECENGCTEFGVCKQRIDCTNGYNNDDGTCRCPVECDKGCTEIGVCKQRDDCKNGYNHSGMCLCPTECDKGCTELGVCKKRNDCKNGYNDDGTCRCPDKCANGCEETGATCMCPSSCDAGCNDIGSQCTCVSSCVEGSSCDTNMGKCKCLERCKFGCDATGTCAEVCENVECKGENEQCQAIEKEEKFEAVCVDLCKGVNCKDNEYCKMGDCHFWDKNNNHLHDKFETATKQGQNCRKYKDCDSVAGAGDGFCDSFLNYTCSTKCTDDSQCVDDGQFHYICRVDGRCAPDSFVTEWRIPKDNTQLRIPTSTASSCNFTIEWGDGTKSEGCVKESKDDTIHCEKIGDKTLIDEGSLLHTYKNSGFMTVKITGQYDGFGWMPNKNWIDSYSYSDNSPTKLYEVKAFGPVGLGTYAFAFSKTGVISFSKVDIPEATKMQDMRYIFYNSQNNLPIENWDMSHVIDMRGMFKYAYKFNQPIDHWDTSSVKWMGNMGEDIGNNLDKPKGVFSYATSFNQTLEHWDTSNVVSISYMFWGASAFNGAVNDWDTSKVMFMYGTFRDAKTFNQPLDHWNTSNVTDMNSAFSCASSFNQSLATWDTSNVTNMCAMFEGAKSFNGAIGNWNTSKVTDMSEMFDNAISFNQPLNQWKVDHVADMCSMFHGATAFNQPLNQWNTSQVTDMSEMFKGATSFNQSLDAWATKLLRVTSMSFMFEDATSFEQDLSSWQFGKKVTVTNIFKNTKLAKDSSNIYCKIFNAWKGKISATTCSDLGMEGCSCE